MKYVVPKLANLNTSIIHWCGTLDAEDDICRSCKELPSQNQLLPELNIALEMSKELDSEFPVVFTHADLHIGNIIYSQQKGDFNKIYMIFIWDMSYYQY